MIREIVHDPLLLAQKSEPATEKDRPIITDLADTLMANRERCVDMAANMIGELSGGHGFLHYLFYNIITTSSRRIQFKTFIIQKVLIIFFVYCTMN